MASTVPSRTFRRAPCGSRRGTACAAANTLAASAAPASSELPHLHYQLMAGLDLFRSDGLPARFTNVWIEAFTTQVIRVAKAKRGIPLTAR